jgi:hypothetical protein
VSILELAKIGYTVWRTDRLQFLLSSKLYKYEIPEWDEIPANLQQSWILATRIIYFKIFNEVSINHKVIIRSCRKSDVITTRVTIDDHRLPFKSYGDPEYNQEWVEDLISTVAKALGATVILELPEKDEDP